MKAEDSPQATPQPTPAPQPAPAPAATQSTFSAAQWGQSQIPIDPALQQPPQHTAPPTYQYHPYSHYPQAQYANYHHYAPPQHQQQVVPQTQPTTTSTARPPTTQPTQAMAPSQQQQQSSSIDTADIATLNDALGSAGVDLRAEEETLHRSNDQYHQYRPYEDRSRKQPTSPAFDNRVLGPMIRAIGTQHKVPTIREDAITYIALALRYRLQELLEGMIAASAHRTDDQWDGEPGLYEDGSPMWSVLVRSDTAKVLAAMERVEREEEMKVRRERKEKLEAAAQAIQVAQQAATAGMAVDSVGGGGGGGQGGGEDADGQPKKKKKKEGPGVTARNMSEDVRKKMSNAVASQAAGLSTQKYAWMNAAAAQPAKKATPAPVAASASTTPGAGAVGGGSGTPGLSPATTTAPAVSASSGSGWARPYVSSNKHPSQGGSQKDDGDHRRVVTLRDAMFVVENEKGHGGGRGSARGWT
ncbi:transcription initiation factor TFIID component TAF4 family-domain-containing protein [Cristinia sonorae]|uniref:Transcription initiation factor TFIID subunit 4 n=1 Tax=Cristinia sonorae TaxID=1940300 RepID=A0A8K0UJ13_9AGAR|nr:transcription initiation factor TFIID component TAF4 family-domain-containing protein [Cristinia sonorae]